MKVKSLSRVLLFGTQWTVAYQAPPSMGFSRQEYWSGLPFPSPGDLPEPEMEPRSCSLQADALISERPGKPLWAILNNGPHFLVFFFFLMWTIFKLSIEVVTILLLFCVSVFWP